MENQKKRVTKFTFLRHNDNAHYYWAYMPACNRDSRRPPGKKQETDNALFLITYNFIFFIYLFDVLQSHKASLTLKNC